MCAVGAQVHTCGVAMLRGRRARAHRGVATLRGRRARAHLRCRSAARSVRTRTPAVSHVRTCRVATLRAWCAGVRAGGGSVTSARVRARPLTSRLSLPMFFATTSTIVRFSMLAAVDGMGVLDST